METSETKEKESASIHIEIPRIWVRVVFWGIAAWFGIHVLDVILTIIFRVNGWW